MPVYTCEKCCKEFKYPSALKRHMNRKTPCKKITEEGLEDIVEDNSIKDENKDEKVDIIGDEFEDSKNNYINLVKPFIKWAGGKTQIIKKIIKHIPKNINNYHEIFIGGGSVLFAILSLQKNNLISINNKIYAYDINNTLINVYKNIQTNTEKIYNYIQQYINEYDSCNGNIINRKPLNINEAKSSKESYYYWMRQKFNNFDDKTDVECSALFIVLNKTCFRGIYREGPNGFNVPYGHYKKTPKMLSLDELNIISDLIKNVNFISLDFNESLKNINKKDFVYFDPPYVPINKKSFVNYNKNGFSLESHKKLFNKINNMSNEMYFLMSNSYTELVLSYFKNYEIEKIKCRRAINSKNPADTEFEVLIYNY